MRAEYDASDAETSKRLDHALELAWAKAVEYIPSLSLLPGHCHTRQVLAEQIRRSAAEGVLDPVRLAELSLKAVPALGRKVPD